jgi:hypothetical protein
LVGERLVRAERTDLVALPGDRFAAARRGGSEPEPTSRESVGRIREPRKAAGGALSWTSALTAIIELKFTPGLRAILARCGIGSKQECKMPARKSRIAALLLVATAPFAAPATEKAGSVDFGGGRQIASEVPRSTSPAVVLVAGGRAGAGDWIEALSLGAPSVFDAISAFHKDQPQPVVDAIRDAVREGWTELMLSCR